jgi:phage I-like protein
MKTKLFSKLIAAANEAIHPKFGLVCASNELIDQGDGWYLIPFGQYPHKEGLQILERADADAMVAAFNDTRGKDPTWKAAVYIGHPDHPDAKVSEKYPDKSAYGWIDQVAANEDGFQFHCDWNPNGKELVDNKSYRYFSPLFWLQAASNVGRKVIRPRIFQSIGLTNTPNMGGCWLANEKEPEQQGDPMNLLERLKALFNKEDIQTEDDVVGIVQRMIDALKKLRDAQKDKWAADDVAYEVAENESVIEHAIRLIEGQDALIAAANEAVPESSTARITELEGLVAAANTAAAGAFIDLAIAQGKVLPADKQTQLDALLSSADLVAAGNDLLSGQPLIKTAATTQGLKVIDMSASQKRDAQIAAANSLQDEHKGLTFREAWKRAETDTRFADLFVSDEASA